MSASNCPVCHGKRWVPQVIPVPGNPQNVTMVPCGCQAEWLANRRLTRLLGQAGLPPDLQGMTFEAFDPGAGVPLAEPTGDLDRYVASRIRARYQAWMADGKDLCQHLTKARDLALDFAEQPQGHLIFVGEPGCGKTHLAAAIANHLIAKRETVCFAVVPDLLDTLRKTFSPQAKTSFDKVFEAYKTAPVLILDDLGTENTTPWAHEKLYQLVNHRYNYRLPMVVTSNEVVAGFDPRMLSRLCDKGRSVIFEILAGDYRLERGAPCRATDFVVGKERHDFD